MKPSFRAVLVLFPLMLSGCVGGMPLNSNKEDLLAELSKEGPEVEGVEDTLVKGAAEMEARGEYDKSTAIYQQLVSMKPNNLDYTLNFAAGLRRIGKLDDAETMYDEVLKKHPKNIDAKEGKALVMLGLGEYEAAGEALTKVYEKDKTRWRSINGLAILLVQRNMPKDAIAYFKEALKQSKNSVAVMNNLGLTYAIDGDYGNARRTFERAIARTDAKSPMRRNLELNLALVMGINGDMEMAEKLLTDNLPPAAVSNNLGLYAYLANDEKLAKGYLNTALSQSPYHYERAWENLTTITEHSKGKSLKTPSAKSKVLKVD
jgi:Flp pilus assembly protein TadD